MGVFEQLFGSVRGKFEQKFSRNSNAWGVTLGGGGIPGISGTFDPSCLPSRQEFWLRIWEGGDVWLSLLGCWPSWNSSYTQSVLWSSIWCINFHRALRLHAFITSLFLRVEKIHYLLLHRLDCNNYCVVTMVTCLFCNTFDFNLWHITLIYIIFKILIVFNDSVLSLPYTLYHLCSTLCDSMYGHRFLNGVIVANIKAHGDCWLLLWL